MPAECRSYGHHGYGYGYHHHYGGSSLFGSLFLMIGLLAICACMMRGGRDPYDDDVIIVQGGQPVYGPNGQIIQQGGQTVVVQGGGYGCGYGGGAVAAGAAAASSEA